MKRVTVVILGAGVLWVLANWPGPLGGLPFCVVLAMASPAFLSLWRDRERELGASRRLFCPWDPFDVALALLAYLTFQVIVWYAIDAAWPGDKPTWLSGLGAAALSIPLVLAVLWLLRWRYGLWPRDLGIRFHRWKGDLLLAVGLLLIVVVVVTALASVFSFLHNVYKVPVKDQEAVSLMKQATSLWGTLVMVTVAVVWAPLWEETMFRGFLQPFFRRYLGGAASIVLTAALFSLIHDPGSTFFRVPVLLFPLALALGYAYHRTQRLAAPIFLHLMFNSWTVVQVIQARAVGG